MNENQLSGKSWRWTAVLLLFYVAACGAGSPQAPASTLLASGPGGDSRATAIPLLSESSVNFTQEFYGWYRGRGVDVVLKERGASLSPELRDLLARDLRAREKADGEIAGLDFDPFLNAQDSVGALQRITPRQANAPGDTWRVELTFASAGGGDTSPQEPQVIAELVRKDNFWMFTNFYYGAPGAPGTTDLVHLLQELQKGGGSP